MKLKSIPETIRTIIEQAGGLGLRGAFVYIGASKLVYRCAQSTGEFRSGKPSCLSTEAGSPSIAFDVGLSCRVNGKRGREWTMIIAYEPDDTYTIWFVEGHAERTRATMVLACHRDVYCDSLQTTVERMYNEAIHQHNQEFIPFDGG